MQREMAIKEALHVRELQDAKRTCPSRRAFPEHASAHLGSIFLRHLTPRRLLLLQLPQRLGELLGVRLRCCALTTRSRQLLDQPRELRFVPLPRLVENIALVLDLAELLVKLVDDSLGMDLAYAHLARLVLEVTDALLVRVKREG